MTIEEKVSNLKNYKPSPRDYRIYYIGDSITRHGFNNDTIRRLKWGHIAGMAADSEDKDYAHLIAAGIKKKMPDKNVVIYFGMGGKAEKALKGINTADKLILL